MGTGAPPPLHPPRGRDGRANLHLLPTGELLYPAAAVVVLLHAEEHSQRHYLAHTEVSPLPPTTHQEVRCIAVHPNRLTVASGQGCPSYRGAACVRIWNAVSLATLQVLAAAPLAR